ncbi:unnamed protein product [Eruca vesicaria subsp. sativa]|uniref:Protein kinase domain-containing protein n=1 Tax=Eruca vesicaria subsp. sativa TaxID=29727 RepID=A0ABC8KEY1_ERUVS|nr:unnamed protein product [Eruca vesicaria subsp. sativa]
MNNKNYSFVFLLSFLTLPIFHSTSCTLECGGIQIPFPFGIEPGCYLDEWYQIECQRKADNEKDFPFLVKMKMEVVNITLLAAGYYSPEFSSVRVRNPITSPRSCWLQHQGIADKCRTRNGGMRVDLHYKQQCTDHPFFQQSWMLSPSLRFHHRDQLLPNHLAYQLGNYVPFCNITREEDSRICNGNGCCQAKAPGDAQQMIGVTITNSDNGNLTTEGDCKVAFLTDEVYTLSNETTPEKLFSKGYATVTLGWFIRTSNASFLPSLGCENREEFDAKDFDMRKAKCTCDNHTVSGISYGSCACSPGCLGNPYSVGDCKEINMCLVDPCGNLKICKHTSAGRDCVNLHIPEILTGLGAGLFVLILVFGSLWLRKFRRRRRISKRKRNFFKRNGGLLLQQQLNTTQGNVEKTKIFTSKELEKATDNFNVDRIVGQGGQGTVYKGMLVDGRSVAVKKSNVVDEDKLQEFINEVIILSQINHRHVVKLLGCCLETEVPVLVYEFITNGNLFQHLHEEFDDYAVLWGVRMRIAVDIAGAFAYLHTAACSPIYHRDIKSTNILLDEKYRAKVSDFGTSRSVTIDHTHWTTVISGTVGYVDPEYYGSSHFTEKSDVYSFGVVLAELITGEKPVITLLNTQEITGLADYFRLAMKENRLFDIIDARIRNNCKLEQVIAVANLAMRCLKKAGKNRPDMREVSTELERICSSPEEFQVQIQIDGEDKFKLFRGDSCSSTVTARTK